MISNLTHVQSPPFMVFVVVIKQEAAFETDPSSLGIDQNCYHPHCLTAVFVIKTKLIEQNHLVYAREV